MTTLEKIARIIDPFAWRNPAPDEQWEWVEGRQEERQTEALAKAAEILASLPLDDETVEEAAKALDPDAWGLKLFSFQTGRVERQEDARIMARAALSAAVGVWSQR